MDQGNVAFPLQKENAKGENMGSRRVHAKVCKIIFQLSLAAVK